MDFKSVGVLEPSRNVLSYKWNLNNFSNYNFVGQCLISPPFSSAHSNGTQRQWRLHLYPNGKQWPYKDYLSVFLEYSDEVEVTAYVTISILDGHYGNAVLERTIQQEQFRKGLNPPGDHKFVSRFFITSSEKRLLKDDTLTILCKIVLPEPISVAPIVQVKNESSEKLKEFDRFEHLLETGKFSDVTLNVDGKRIRLHKVILASCSPVFQAMFEHSMKENQLNAVDIVDVSYEVMREIVRFMYTNKVNGLDELAVELLVAADMYAITELKDLCEKTLCDRVNVDNAIEHLRLAIMYNATALKSRVIEFILRNLQDFVDQAQFRTIDSSIFNELFSAIAKKRIVAF